MSNAEASKLYENIIEEVINESRQDFEDGGIDESTLQELRKIWCEKLTQAHVAKFSWDDELEKKDVYQDNLPDLNNNNLLGGANHHLNMNMNMHMHMNNIPLNNQNNLEIKPNFNTNGLELPNVNQNQFSYSQQGNIDNGIGIEIPNLKDDDNSNSTGLMLPRINQADGTFSFTLETSNGAGFMDKLKSKNKTKIDQADGALDDDDDDDDIFNDSDDINSDLDEGLESEKSDEDDGDQEGQIMLCLYDKVQRVKNKWKSNLKEGIANIDGRDYVFQKATGESEW